LKLNKTDSQKFDKLAVADKERYTTEMETYKKTLPPKKPQGAFVKYFSEIRPKLLQQHPNISIAEVGKKAGEMWGKLSEAQKNQYKADAKKALDEWKVKYNKQD
jgi:hypothetical protein